MSTKTPAASETLTDDMIRELRSEAASAGDKDMVMECDMAIGAPTIAVSRWHVANAINKARAQDDSAPFVIVIP